MKSFNGEERIEINDKDNFVNKVIKWNSNEELEEFSVGDQCMFCSRENEVEWVLTITACIIVAPISGKYYIAIDGDFFIPG